MTSKETLPNVRGFNLESFNAEAKRSWFSVRESLKGMTSKGGLWLPAKVTIERGWLEVSTAESQQRFRPHRLAWRDPEQFIISGWNDNHNLRRSILRFQTAGSAQFAASTLKENATIVEEAIPIVEEIQALVRSLPSSKRALRLAMIFLSYLPLEVLALWALSGGSFSGPFILVDLSLYFGVVLFLTISVMVGTKRTVGSLKFEGKSLAFRTKKRDWIWIAPGSLERKDARTLILPGPFSRIEVTLSTEESATEVVQRIKLAFPAVREIPAR